MLNRKDLPEPFLIVLLAIFGLLYSYAGVMFGMNVFDDGLRVYGASRILSGYIPYKDFYLIYPPGEMWSIAMLFRIFGPSLALLRIVFVAVSCVLSITAYAIARKIASRRIALFAWFFVLLWADSYRPIYHLPLGLFLALLGSYFLFNFLTARKTSYLFLGGIFSALILLLRLELGIFTLVAQLAFIALLTFGAFSPCAIRPAERIKPGFKYLAYYLSGYGFIFLPVVVYLFLNVPIRDLYFNLSSFPASYTRYYSLRFPALLPNPVLIFSKIISLKEYLRQALTLRVPMYFPAMVYLSALVAMGFKIRRNKGFPPDKALILFTLIVLGLLFHTQGSLRAHIQHLRPTIIVAFIVFPFVLENLWKKRILRVILITAICLTAVWPLCEKMYDIAGIFTSRFSFDLAFAKGIVGDEKGRDGDGKGRDYQELVRYIQKNVPPGERIFSGNKRHDRIFANDMMIYFLSGRQSATKFYHLDQCLATTQQFQEKIISDIQKYHVNYIVLYGAKKSVTGAAESSGVYLLDEFIRREFAFDRDFGESSVWKRRPGF